MKIPFVNRRRPMHIAYPDADRVYACAQHMGISRAEAQRKLTIEAMLVAAYDARTIDDLRALITETIRQLK